MDIRELKRIVLEKILEVACKVLYKNSSQWACQVRSSLMLAIIDR